MLDQNSRSLHPCFQLLCPHPCSRRGSILPPEVPGLAPGDLLPSTAPASCAQRTPMPEYPYRVVDLSRDMARDAARRILTDDAEHGDWELAWLRRYADGSSK